MSFRLLKKIKDLLSYLKITKDLVSIKKISCRFKRSPVAFKICQRSRDDPRRSRVDIKDLLSNFKISKDLVSTPQDLLSFTKRSRVQKIYCRGAQSHILFVV